MQWSDKLLTGIPDFDEQHKNLFVWFAELESAAADLRMMTAAYALTRLTQYTRSHFTAEEDFMRAIAYPDLEAHQAEHDEFRLRLKELQNLAQSCDISHETVAMLRQWMVRHIMGTDMDYVPYISAVKPATRDVARGSPE